MLYSALLRDLLIRLAIADLCELYWSAEVQSEWTRNLSQVRPELEATLKRTRALMEQVLPNALLSDAAPLPPEIQLPDPNDHHVLAAAIQSGTGTLLTFNLRDFPLAICQPLDVVAVHPDEWLAVVLAQDETLTLRVFQCLLAPLQNPPLSLIDFAAALRRQVLPMTADLVTALV